MKVRGAEFDALTPARKYYVYLSNSRIAKSIKRFRKKGKENINKLLEDNST
jgi:hypothetical protein